MNYEELVAVSRAYADRGDIDVGANMDNFIIFVEARMNRVLKTRKQGTRAFIATADDKEYYSLPPDYAGLRDYQVNSDVPSASHKSHSGDYMTPKLMNVQRNKPFGGRHYYSIIANQIQIFPKEAAGNTIEIVYYQKVPNLNETDNNNWMSEDYPDIYLAGMVSEIEFFVKNYTVAEGWRTRMTNDVQELDMSDTKERWTESPLQTRLG